MTFTGIPAVRAGRTKQACFLFVLEITNSQCGTAKRSLVPNTVFDSNAAVWAIFLIQFFKSRADNRRTDHHLRSSRSQQFACPGCRVGTPGNHHFPTLKAPKNGSIARASTRAARWPHLAQLAALSRYGTMFIDQLADFGTAGAAIGARAEHSADFVQRGTSGSDAFGDFVGSRRMTDADDRTPDRADRCWDVRQSAGGAT